MKALGWIVVAVSTTASAQPDLTVRATPPEPAHWQRMLLETAAVFGVGEAYYYRGDGRASADDWQLPGNWSALGRKLTGDGIRFDSNGFVTNAVKHPMLFGAGVYGLARQNGYSLAESFLISSAVSIGWEFVGEWREYASINDLATTSTAGTPIGEAVYQIAHHLRSTRFELHGGLGRVDGTSFQALGASADLEVPERKVRLALEVPFDHAVRAIDFRSYSSLFGHNLDGDGYHLFVGGAAAYDYLEKMDRPDWQWDLLANVRVGPTAQLDLYRHGVAFHAALDATGDFAMVRSYGYDAWRAAHPMAVVQGVLQTNAHDYYYALGLTLAPSVAVEYRGISAGTTYEHSSFSSLDGYDRDQEIETAHVHATDRADTSSAWLGARVGNAVLRLSATQRDRAGAIGDSRAASTERTLVVSLGYAN